MRTRALSLHQQGWSWTKIATELGCHRTTVMRLVHKWQQTGCIADLPHRRRPRALSHQHLQQQQQQQPQQQQQVTCSGQPLPAHNRLVTPSHPLKSRWQEENRKLPASSSTRSTTVTVRRRLKELRSQLGIPSPPSPKPPSVSSLHHHSINSKASQQQVLPLVTPEKQQSKPPRALQEICAFSVEELSHIVFSDMKIFLADREGGVRVWRLGQPPLDSYSGLQEFFQRGGLSATFWVCISGSGKKGHLLHIPNELTEERYVQILHNGLLPSAAAIYGLNAHRFLFAQDKASIQASPVVEDFLRQQQVQCAEWPARSAEFNPCDLLWPEVERALPTGRQPRTVPELVQMVRVGYESVDVEYIQWLVAPVRIRSLCRRMMRAAGAATSSEEHSHQEK
ncbi:Transposable element Tcb1 transposase, partial [Stegodyphus mimosarum]